MAGNSLCRDCLSTVGQYFCICSCLPFICPSCEPKHRLSPGFHFLLPSSAYGLITLQNQQRYKVWLLSLSNSQEKLATNNELMDRCKGEIIGAFEDAKRLLDELKAKRLTQFAELQRAITAKIKSAIAETTENATNYYYVPEDELAKLIWVHSRDNSSDPIPVFRYTVRLCEEEVKSSVFAEFEGMGEGFDRLIVKGNHCEWKMLTLELQKEIFEYESIINARILDEKMRDVLVRRGEKATQTALETPKSTRFSPPVDLPQAAHPSNRLKLPCITCGQSRTSSHFSISKAIFSHGCKMCDNCFRLYGGRFGDISKCPACGLKYSKSELEVVTELTQSSDTPHKARKIETKTQPLTCKCGDVIPTNGLKCVNLCICPGCLMVYYFMTGIPQCPTCRTPIPTPLPTELQCSNCYKPLHPGAESVLEAITGLCPCGALLCCFCLLTSEAGKCIICSRSVRAIADVREVRKIQERFTAGCYCGSGSDPRARLKCGHMAHNECRFRLFRCRVCREEIKDPPKRKMIKDYIP